MIYTVTLNPSIDYIIELDTLTPGEINRTTAEDIVFGGKGINVSSMLAHWNIESVALGFCAGFTGKALEDGVRSYGITPDFVHVDQGFTRINVKIKAKEESEINGQGPRICQDQINALLEKIDALQDGDMLVLSGNVPGSLPFDIYHQIMQRVKEKDVDVIVDATQKSLTCTLEDHPFLIKPNHHELAEMFQTEIHSEEDICFYARKLQQQGAKNVLVSMAKDGAMLVDEFGKVHRMHSPKGEVVNSVGAGDSMVGGFIYGYLFHHDYKEALRYGIACGSASAFCKGIAKRENVECLLKQMEE